ncbi:MAG TPA: dinitrogenase iron-molybdenum cofactor [Desulfurella acetivorans]|uniref:Dinitrogenase iron-molybdenum cofactor n=1 Tax=Desulfurella acetivorans TaxID=33002 RepID=A0A7C6ED35_DESAE|nr:dinitrogenase iron-molybdenum cofactor [Desulfurella acetivorans]
MIEGKIATAAMGNSPEAPFSQHFATATHFLIYDTATGHLEVVENTARDLSAGKGVAAAKMLIEKRVKGVVVEFIGPRPFSMLQEAGVKVYPGIQIKAQDVLDSIKAGKLSQPLEAPTETSHTGQHGDHQE